MGKACESGEEWKEAGSESRGGADKGALVVRDGERLWRLGGGGGYKGGGQTRPEDSWGRPGFSSDCFRRANLSSHLERKRQIQWRNLLRCHLNTFK